MRRFVGIGCVWVVLACGGTKSVETAPNGCVPGRQVTCTCDGGDTGVQRCQDDGSFGECVCTEASGGDGGASTANTASAIVDGGTLSSSGGATSSGQGGTAGLGEGGADSASTSATSSTTTTDTTTTASTSVATTAAGAGGTAGGTTGGQTLEDACPGLVSELPCGAGSQSYQAPPANVLIVLDKSGSMGQQASGQVKWSAMQSALAAALATTQNAINYGLELYPMGSTPGELIDRQQCGLEGNCCDMPDSGMPTVPIASGANAVNLITSALDQTDPGGGTPTAHALAQAFDYFTLGAGADLTGEKLVVLATDGGPNCSDGLVCGVDLCTYNLDDAARDCTAQSADNNCCAGISAGCVDSANVVARIEQLGSAGIGTFVVGIPGSEVYSSFLDEFAEAGGHALTGGSYAYYRVDDVGQLGNVFEEIARSVGCGITLPTSGLVAPRVILDCSELPSSDAASGLNWEWESTSGKLTLLGQACDSVVSGNARLDFVLECAPGL